MATKRPGDTIESNRTAWQEKAQRQGRGDLSIKDGVDLATLKSSELDSSIVGYESGEVECYEAFGAWPSYNVTYADDQAKWMELFVSQGWRNIANKRATRDSEFPNRRRVRKVVKFFLTLLEDPTIGDNDLLKDAICYRLAAWINMNAFKDANEKNIQDEMKLLTGLEDTKA